MRLAVPSIRQQAAKHTCGGRVVSAWDTSAKAELAEAAMLANMVEIAGPDVRSALGLDARRIGGGVVVRMAAAPGVPSFTRAVGLGMAEPVTESTLDAALDYLREAGVCSAQPPLWLPKVERYGLHFSLIVHEEVDAEPAEAAVNRLWRWQ